MVDENKKFNVNFTKSGLSDYILQEILKKSSVEDGLSELQKTNSKIEQRIKKVVDELENNEIVANKISSAIENVQQKTFGTFDNIKNQFTITGKNYKKLLVEINKSLNSKDLSDINASASGYQASTASFAARVEKSYEDYKEKLKELAEQAKKQEAEAKKQEAELNKYLSARNVKTLDELKAKTEAATKEGNDLLKQFTTSTNNYMESLNNTVGGTLEEVNAAKSELFNSDFLGVSDKPLSKGSIRRLKNSIIKNNRAKAAEKRKAEYDKKIQDAANKVTPLSSSAVSDEYRNEVIENATENTKLYKQGMLGAIYPVEDNPHKMMVNTYRRKRLARLGSIGQLEVLPDGRVLSVHRDRNNNRINARFIGGASRSNTISSESEFAGILGHAGSGPQGQGELVNTIPPQPAGTPLGVVTPKNGNKPETPNKPTTNSFDVQKQKSEVKQRQKGFIALLIPELKKLLDKSPIADLIKFGLLMLGKNHPVLAAAGLTMGMPIMTGLLSNALLGNPLGKLFKTGGTSIFGSISKGVIRGGRNVAKGIKGIPAMASGIADGAKGAVKGVRDASLALRAGGPKMLWEYLKPAEKIAKPQSYGAFLKGAAKSAKFGKGFTKGVPIVGALLDVIADIPEIGKAAKEGRLGGQLLKTGAKATGGAVGAIAGGILGGPLGALAGGFIGNHLGSAIGDVMKGFTAVAGKSLPRLMSAFGKLGHALGPLFNRIKNGFDKILKALGIKSVKLTGFFEALGRTLGKVIDVLAEWIEKLSLWINRKEIEHNDKEIKDLGDSNSGAYKDAAKKYREEKVQEILKQQYDSGKMDEKTKKDYEAGKIKQGIGKNHEYWNKVYNDNKNAIENYANHKIQADKAALEQKNNELKNTAVTQSDDINDAKYGNAANGLKRYTKNGVKNTVDMRDLGLYGSVWKNNSMPYVPAENVGRVKALDEWFHKRGYQALYTSNMGGHAANSGHGQGRKLDVQLTKNGKQVRLTQKEEAELQAMGFFDGKHSLGWETQKDGGHHYDLSIASTSSVNKTVPKTGTAAATTMSAGAGYNVVSASDIYDAVLKHTGGTTNSHTDKVRNLIFSSTDVTGSLGVFGITQINNTGHKKGA